LTTETVTINPLLKKRLEDIKSKISSKYTIKHLLATGDNVQTIVDYLPAMNTEINYSSSYGIATIGTLYRFSKYHKNKPFKDITRDDIVDYLDSLRKTETQDTSSMDC
jgi:CRP-like cAMP-binding protein